MASIENGFGNMIGNVSGGFSGSILGQANYINQLQQGGASPAGPAIGEPSKEQIVARLRADPAFQQQAIRAMQQDPALLRRAVKELAARPDLARALPPSVKQFLISALRGGASG